MILRRRDKSGTYYFRFFWQNKEFSKSLYTKDYNEAKQIKKELENLVKAQIDGKQLKASEIHEIFDKYLSKSKKPTTKEAFKSRNERLKYYRNNNKLNDLDIGVITELKLLKDILALPDNAAGDKERLKKLHTFKKQITPLVPNYIDLINKNSSYIILQAQLELTQHDRKNFGVQDITSYSAVSLSKAYDMYITAKKADGLKSLSFVQVETRLKLMLNLLSNYELATPLNSFGIFDFDNLQKIIREYPANASQRGILKECIKDTAMVIELAQQNNIEPMSLKTANGHLRELNAFLEFCVKKELIQKNLFNFTANAKNNVKNKKKAYDENDIKNLLKSPLFTKNFHRTMQHKQEWIWIILLAMFTGARLTEICQLRASDIDTANRTISIQEIDDEFSSLKNENSTRIIPICDFLVDCGFVAYCLRQYANNGRDSNLWGWEKNRLVEKYGWGRYFGKRFNEYNRNYITDDKQKSFHSFRHTVITYLNRYYPELHIVSQRFVGHAHESINLNVYTHTEWEEKMRTVANGVAYPNNSEELAELRSKLLMYYGF